MISLITPELSVDQLIINHTIEGLKPGEEFLLFQSNELNKLQYIHDNTNCISLNLSETLQFYNKEKLCVNSEDYCCVSLPVNTNVRIFFTSLGSYSSITIPRINVTLEAIPGEVRFVDLNFNKIGSFVGIATPSCCRTEIIPIYFNIISHSDFLEHKYLINRITPVLY